MTPIRNLAKAIPAIISKVTAEVNAVAATVTAAAGKAPASGFDDAKKKPGSFSGVHRAATPALPVNEDLRQFVVGQRSVVQAGATGQAAMKVGAGDVAKAATLDLAGYTSAQLRKLDVVGDGKLDANEINGVVAFADIDFDGKVGTKEQLALDYLMGKDTTVPAAKAFVELHGDGRIGDISKMSADDTASAEKTFAQKDKAHDTLVYEITGQERDMRAYMGTEGVTWTNDAPAQVKEQIAALGKSPDPEKLRKLELQLVYSEMRASNAVELQKSYDGKEAAKKVMADTRVENREIQALATDAAPRVDGAMQVVASHESQALVSEMIALRSEVETNPKVRDAVVTYMKASAILNAARDGKLDIDEVDVDAVKADIKSSQKIIDDHTRRMEAGASKIARNLEDPAFLARIDKLPDDERTQALTDMHSLIADTEAGRDFFKKNILPGLNGKDVKRPEIYDQLKISRHGSKLALNLVGVWGARIAHAGGDKHAIKLMDNALARAIGLRPDQMPKIYKALEITAGKDGDGLSQATRDKAAKDFLAKDPELKKISGRINTFAGGVAFASATLAAVDLVRNPSVRTSLGAAKSAAEVSEVISRMAKVPPSVARYARFAGRLGPPLDVIIGGLDGYKAAKRSDVAGAIGGFGQAAGGLVGTAGLIAAAAGATGVGMPLAVIGGAVAVLGSLVSAIWGDSPTEQWLKDNAPEYIK